MAALCSRDGFEIFGPSAAPSAMGALARSFVVEPTLVIIGVNYRSASVEVRERFWISESRRYEALVRLARSEAIEEVAVLATCNRTEFILWASDPAIAANSVLNFLTTEYGLRLAEWSHFYRLIGEAAVVHLFKVASSLDSIILGEPEIATQMKDAWSLAQRVATCGRHLDAAFQKALAVVERVQKETSVGQAASSVPYAAVELARQLFGSLEDRKVVLLGAGHMGQLAAEYLVKNGANDLRVINRTVDRAQELTERLGGIAAPYEERWQHIIDADIVISATACPHIIFTREEGDYVRQERQGRPLLMIDIAVPRDIDPRVRQVHGIFLYDVDDLDEVVRRSSGDHVSAAEQATNIVQTEAKFFARKLVMDRSIPTAIALRERLDEMAKNELDAFRQEAGPFSAEQEQALQLLARRIASRFAGLLSKELKNLSANLSDDQLSAALKELFQLPSGTALPTGSN
ncbi:MAG TPA: glutamyl-tRNA reductase [Terriglobales bacterium]|nr:glutamyl-tRNA reductase [Terriglobales bacterium]